MFCLIYVKCNPKPFNEDESIMRRFQKKRILALSKKLSLFILFLTLVFSFSGIGFSECAKKINLVFRYDDYCSQSPTDLEIKIFQDFLRFQMSLNVGIIPFAASSNERGPSHQELIPLTEEKTALLRSYIDSGTVIPSLHGYSHQTVINDFTGIKSEFRGLSYQEQLIKIEKGKKFLEDRLGRDINIFAPPWNIYDRNTLRVVEELGFTTISAGLHSTPDKDSNLKFLPETENISNLRSVIKNARKVSSSPVVILVLFHDYDFLEIDKDLGRMFYKQFQALLEWIAGQEDVTVVPLEEAATKLNLGAVLFAKNRSYYKTQRLIPPFVAKKFDLIKGTYLSSSVFNDLMNRSRWILFAYSLIILLTAGFVAFLFGKYLFIRYKKIAILVYASTLPVLILLALYSLKDGFLSHKGLTGLLIITGCILGLTSRILKGKTSFPRKWETRITK